jgi:hypothetical protein
MIYYAKIIEQSDAWFVEFPELEGCFTEGETLNEALDNAKERMGGHLLHGPVSPVAIMSPLVKKKIKTRKGNPHLRKLLIQAANGATKKRGSFYRSKYRKLKARLGSPNKAKVAVANRLARAIYKVLGGENYKDLGYMRGDPLEKQIGLLVRKLKN